MMTRRYKTNVPSARAQQEPTMPHDTERKKQTAMAFYDLMFNQCRPREAIAQYAGEVYVQHNPYLSL